MRNVASVAELTKSFFAEINKVEDREDLEKLRVKYLGREKGILTAVLRSFGGMPLAKRKGLGPQARELKQVHSVDRFGNPGNARRGIDLYNGADKPRSGGYSA